MKKTMLVFSFLFFLVINAYAQEDALVFFQDKENVDTALQNPISILTQKAIDRKLMHNSPIDARDVPVNETYITTIKGIPGITVFAKSKWMNCVYVRGNLQDLDALEGLDFVTHLEYADKSLNLVPIPGGSTKDKLSVENKANSIVYDYGAATNQVEMIAANYLHQQDFTGEGIDIAVLDSGFPGVLTNPAFDPILDQGRLLGTYNFISREESVDTSSSHGSKTFSDIGGYLQNQFVGTAPGASFYLFVTEDVTQENPVEEAWWVEALERADSLGVRIVNTSLGYQDYDNPAYTHSYEDLNGFTTIAARGANHAFDKGMLLLTSAGNDGQSFGFVATPADAPGCLSIGAVDQDGEYAGFSSYGPNASGLRKPDVMAQGVSVAVVDQNGAVDFNSGTSFSSPIMAGAIASLWQSRPEVTNAQIMQIVRASAHLFENPTDLMGYGIPNFETAYNALQILGAQADFLEIQFAMYPNPAQDIVSFSIPLAIEKATVRIFTSIGQQVLSSEISANQNTIDISGINSGTYIVSVESGGTKNYFKLIKK
ncbi:S8 family serine peptidase [Flavobacteriaceae bacterium]|nr:S8 family serine peptidase [Flavobacteriaceae bacterium]